MRRYSSEHAGNSMSLLDKNTSNQIKGLAISLVLIGHAGLVSNAGAWGVSIFLFLSGFGLYQSYSRNGIGSFFSKRICTIFIPFTIVTILQIIIDYFFFSTEYSSATIFLTLLGLNLKATVDPTMWFISFLLIWYLLFYCVFNLKLGDTIRISLLFLGGLCLIFANNLFSPAAGMFLYTFCFPVGVLFSSLINRVTKIVKQSSPIWLGTIFVVCFLFFLVTFQLHFLSIGKVAKYICYFISNWFFTISVIGAFLLLRLYNKDSRILLALGSLSYEIYLVEGFYLVKYPAVFSGNLTTGGSAILFVYILITAYFLQQILRKIINIEFIKRIIRHYNVV